MSQLYTPQLYWHNHADHNSFIASFAVTIQAITAWAMNKQALVIWDIPIPAITAWALNKQASVIWGHTYTGQATVCRP